MASKEFPILLWWRHLGQEFIQGESHINGIESLWGFAKTGA